MKINFFIDIDYYLLLTYWSLILLVNIYSKIDYHGICKFPYLQ